MLKLKFTWRNRPLVVKLTLVITILVVLTAGSVTLLSIRRDQQTFRIELEQQADLLLDVLTTAAVDPLYMYDVDTLSDMIENLGVDALGINNPRLASGRIYDAQGRILGDAYDPFVAYNLQVDPFAQKLLNTNATIFDWQPDKLVAGRPVTVGNQKLGAISVGLSTAPLKAKLASARNQGLAVALITVVTGLTLALLLSRSITGPLHQLVLATQHISKGDLSQKITIDSGDELEVLGLAMDQMRAELQSLYQNLEQKIAERTATLTMTNQKLQTEIIERKRIEEDLIVARDQALQASRLKTELLARVSHELRTPLGVILGYAELLSEDVYGPISNKYTGAIAKIISSTDDLTRLVNELLDQAKLEAGKLALNIQTFAPVEIVDDVMLKMSVLAQNKGLTLTKDIDPNLPATLTGDPVRIRQILINLVSNAIKFTKQGSVHIYLACPDKTDWSIQVIDTGLGIPAEAKSYVFEPFRQVDGSMTRHYGGSGLGLSIVKQLTSLMGGEVMLHTEVGCGSTFIIRLPLEPKGEKTL